MRLANTWPGQASAHEHRRHSLAAAGFLRLGEPRSLASSDRSCSTLRRRRGLSAPALGCRGLPLSARAIPASPAPRRSPIIARPCGPAHGAGRDRVAIRTMRSTTSRICCSSIPTGSRPGSRRAACWTCQEPARGVAGRRYLRDVEKAASMPGVEHRTFLQDAGFTHGAASGAFVTGDLCPSRKPLDRRFFEKMMSGGRAGGAFRLRTLAPPSRG